MLSEAEIVADYEAAIDGAVESLRKSKEQIRHLWLMRRRGDLSQGDFLEAMGGYADAAGYMACDVLRLMGRSLEKNAISGEAAKHVEDAREPGAEG